MKLPYPYFGGKSMVAHEIWQRFGDVYNFVDPFFGGNSVLVKRPHWNWSKSAWVTSDNRIETINDIDGYLCNFWRAVQAEPEEVAYYADYPVNELDLHARHKWLIEQSEFVETLRADPEWFDTKIAGWWVWGISCWIGGEWCKAEYKKRPELYQPRGIHRASLQMPHVGNRAQKGVHRAPLQVPHLSRPQGVHRAPLKMPHVGVGAQRGINKIALIGVDNLATYFATLQARLRRVRVCCGDWSRVCGPTPTYKTGLTAMILDPPYAAKERDDVYNHDSYEIALDVQKYAIEHGSKIRIALCGYEGDYDMPETWEVFRWKAHGGYSNNNRNGNDNKHKEVIWFSPLCLKPDKQLSLLEYINDETSV